MGESEMICSDRSINVTAQLTHEFAARMSATLQFSAPDNWQSNGLMEQFNGTFKSMLFDVVRKHGRNGTGTCCFFYGPIGKYTMPLPESPHLKLCLAGHL